MSVHILADELRLHIFGAAEVVPGSDGIADAIGGRSGVGALVCIHSKQPG